MNNSTYLLYYYYNLIKLTAFGIVAFILSQNLNIPNRSLAFFISICVIDFVHAGLFVIEGRHYLINTLSKKIIFLVYTFFKIFLLIVIGINVSEINTFKIISLLGIIFIDIIYLISAIIPHSKRENNE